MKIYIEFTNGDHESFESGEFWVYTAEEMERIKDDAVRHPGVTLINADAIRLMVTEPEIDSAFANDLKYLTGETDN